MNGFYQQIKRQNTASAVATIVLGLLLLLAPGGVVTSLLRLVGWVMIIAGGLMLLSCMGRDNGSHQTLNDSFALIIPGGVLLLLGIWIVRSPGNLVSIALTCVGILLLLHAFGDIAHAVSARKVMAQGWWSAAVSGGITLIMALMILSNPFGTAMSVLRLAGICLLIDGAGDLLMARRMRGYF